MNAKNLTITAIIILCINIVLNILPEASYYFHLNIAGINSLSFFIINNYFIPIILLIILVMLYLNINKLMNNFGKLSNENNENILKVLDDNGKIGSINKDQNKFVKKIIMISIISLLCLSALIGIIIFLIGDFDDFKGKILFTTLAIDFFSITGLCSVILFNRKINVITLISSLLGIISAISGFIFTVLFIWEAFDRYDNWNVLFFFIALSFSLSHINLFLVIKSSNIIVKIIQAITIIFILIVFILFLYIVIARFYTNDDSFWKMFGICCILDVLGTIATPILNRILK